MQHTAANSPNATHTPVRLAPEPDRQVPHGQRGGGAYYVNTGIVGKTICDPMVNDIDARL